MEFVELLNIPKCPEQRIPVAEIVRQIEATSTEKKSLETHIASMYLVSILNQQTIKIRPYKDDMYSYQSIYIFDIKLKKEDSLKDFCKLVHSAFPEPTILLLTYKKRNYISFATKRINKLDETKTVVEEVVNSELKTEKDISEYLNIGEALGNNLKEYYGGLIDLIYKLKVYYITGIYPSKTMDYEMIIKQYEDLTVVIKQLKQSYNQATMMAEKIKIDNDLYDKEIELNNLKKNIRGEN